MAVEVHNAPTEIDAKIVVNLLSNYDIYAEIRDAGIIGANPLFGAAIAGIKVMVNEADEANAKKIVDQYLKESINDDNSDLEESNEPNLSESPQNKSNDDEDDYFARLAKDVNSKEDEQEKPSKFAIGPNDKRNLSQCPKCGSKQTINLKVILAFILGAIFLKILIYNRSKGMEEMAFPMILFMLLLINYGYICLKCGKYWRKWWKH